MKYNRQLELALRRIWVARGLREDWLDWCRETIADPEAMPASKIFAANLLDENTRLAKAILDPLWEEIEDLKDSVNDFDSWR